MTRPRCEISMRWRCLDETHAHASYDEAQVCLVARATEHLRDPFALPTPRYLVHQAGQVQEDGSQVCAHCGFVLLDEAPSTADRNLWGFPLGRRVAQLPMSGAFYLITPDRQLANDEVPCR